MRQRPIPPTRFRPLTPPPFSCADYSLTHAGCTVLGGLLGDAVGRRKIFALSSVVLGLSAVPFFYLLQMGSQVRAGQRERVKGHNHRGGSHWARLVVAQIQ